MSFSFVHAFEVGDSARIQLPPACRARLNQLADAATEYSLFAEEIRFVLPGRFWFPASKLNDANAFARKASCFA